MSIPEEKEAVDIDSTKGIKEALLIESKKPIWPWTENRKLKLLEREKAKSTLELYRQQERGGTKNAQNDYDAALSIHNQYVKYINDVSEDDKIQAVDQGILSKMVNSKAVKTYKASIIEKNNKIKLAELSKKELPKALESLNEKRKYLIAAGGKISADDKGASAKPSENASAKPSENASAKPSENASAKPSENASAKPSENASAKPSEKPSKEQIDDVINAASAAVNGPVNTNASKVSALLTNPVVIKAAKKLAEVLKEQKGGRRLTRSRVKGRRLRSTRRR